MEKQDEGMEVEQGLALIAKTVGEVNYGLEKHGLRLEAKLEIKPHRSPKPLNADDLKTLVKGLFD